MSLLMQAGGRSLPKRLGIEYQIFSKPHCFSFSKLGVRTAQGQIFRPEVSCRMKLCPVTQKIIPPEGLEFNDKG